MDTYTSIVVILCIALFAINLIFACFTCFSILHSFMTETTNQDFSDLRKNLIESEEAKPDDEKSQVTKDSLALWMVMIVAKIAPMIYVLVEQRQKAPLKTWRKEEKTSSTH
ncbi:hypothetical protein YC2023_111900 [Brassica napus]